MRYLAPGLSIAGATLIAFATGVAAQDADPMRFGGEDYSVAFEETGKDGNSIVEFVRAGEKIDSWKKLVAFHHFPKLDDPKAAAKELALLARQRDPESRVRIMENAATDEVIVDFTASEANSEVVELDIFKYGRHGTDGGVIAFQFAQRFTLGETDASEFAKVHDAAVNEAASLDLALADNYFGDDDEDEETSGDEADE